MVLICMMIKDRSGYTVKVDFEYMHTLCKRYVCNFADDYSFVILTDASDSHLVDYYLLLFNGVDEKSAFMDEFAQYQDDVDLDELVGTWDMTLES